MRKFAVAASLQPATDTAVRKFAVAASLQQATDTAVRKFVVAASLQPATGNSCRKKRQLRPYIQPQTQLSENVRYYLQPIQNSLE